MTHATLDHRSSSLTDVVCVATIAVDGQGVIRRWSHGAQRLLGHHRREVLGRYVGILLSVDIAKEPRRLLTTGEAWSGTVTLVRADGGQQAAGLLAYRRQADGELAEWLLIGLVAGSATSASGADEQELERLPYALALYDDRLRVVKANHTASQVLSLAESHSPDSSVATVISHAGADIEQPVALALSTGEQQTVVIHLPAAQPGRGRTWLGAVIPLSDQASGIRGACLAVRDMTGLSLSTDRLLRVHEAGTRIGSTLDVVRTAQELVDVLVPVSADEAHVDLFAFVERGDDPPPGPPAGALWLRRTAQANLNDGASDAGAPPVSGAATEYSATSAQARCVALQRAVRCEQPIGSADEKSPPASRSVIFVPLFAHGLALGIVTLIRSQRATAFKADDLLLAEELSARAAVCLDNARRHARERATAAIVQRTLVTEVPPDLAALQAASRYIPAGGASGGSDWFDVIALSGARVAVVVGDVVGHGVQATTATGRMRAAVRTLSDIDLDPEEVLTHLDDLVIRLATEFGIEFVAGVGATCLYAIYDPVSRVCTIASAGHPPPVVVRPDGSVEIPDVPVGPPLGLGGLPFESVEVELPEGSLLALYTDGLIKSRDRDLDESLAMLCDALGRPAASLDDMCDVVLSTLMPSGAEDDVAFLLARTRGLDTDHVATWDVVAEPAEVSQVRAKTVAQLTEWGLDGMAFSLELVVSELVTNAIRYGQAPVRLRLIHGETVICEVADASSTAPHMRRARAFDEGGRGLPLVANLVERWGTRYSRNGKIIWAEGPVSMI